MKTARQILLEQHHSADSRLKEIQAKVIAQEVASRAERHKERLASERQPQLSVAGMIFGKLWSELFFPARRIWGSFAMVWAAMIAFNLATSDCSNSAPASSESHPAEAIAAWNEQRIILAELMAPATPRPAEPADRPKSNSLKPRSEIRLLTLVA